MSTFNNNRVEAAQTNSTGKRVLAPFVVAIALLMTFTGCQWMYTDMSDPPSTKKDFVWDNSKTKSNRNSFNMSGLSDESQAIEKNLGGR